MKRGKNDHLTDDELSRLTEMARAGIRNEVIAVALNMSLRCVQMNKNKLGMGGTMRGHRFADDESRESDASRAARKQPPAKPNAIPSIPLSRLMAGRA